MSNVRLKTLDFAAERPLALTTEAPRQVSSITLGDAVSALARHIRATTLIVVTALLVAAVAIIMLPPKYQAETKILVRVGREQVAPLEVSGTKYSNFVFNQRSETVNDEVELLRRPQLMDLVFGDLKRLLAEREAIIAPKVAAVTPLAIAWSRFKADMNEPLHALRDSLTDIGLITARTPDMELRQEFIDALGVSVIKETNVIVLTFSWSDKIFATEAVNAYAEAYRREHVRLESDLGGMAELYAAQAARTSDELGQATATLNAFLAELGVTDPGAERQVLLTRIQAEEQQISEATISQDQIGRQIDAYRTQFEQTHDWLETPAIAMTALPGLSDLDTKHAELLVQRDRLLTQFRPGTRQVQDLETQISQLRKMKLQSLVNFMESRQQAERQRIMIVRDQLAQSHARLDQLTLVQQKFVTLQEHRNELLEQLKTYRSQAEYLGLQKALSEKGLSSVTVLGAAGIPQSPIAPKKALIFALASVLALMVAFGHTLISEMLFTGFRNERHVHAFLALPTVASVPLVRVR